ncbi:Glucose-repressible protein Grg1 [Ceraceosorus bombacis]|uniref:Glucose-repressible protein Grg1 n=1 Tax=Ceraceosorus bombacis TaxID=401625 RepID=A0A0P1BEV7_9BASI|nr:Glucose-repressible protein Grg1 [Ceraceosorus bombacis]
MQTVKDAVNNVSETIQGKGHEASAEANKGVAKDSNASLGNRAEAAKDYVGDKIDQNKHEGKAELHEQKLKQ